MVMAIDPVLGSLLSGKDGDRTKFLKNIINEKRRFIREQNPYQIEFSIYIDFTHKNAIQGEFIARISRL